MPSTKTKKLIGFTPEQIEMINELAARQGTTFTAIVSEAVDDYAAVRATGMNQILDRLLIEHGDVIDRLSRT
ncbi:hypothetical protein SCB71_05345 [Herbiconiux sp. KACC 21604]|uniref:hypothetical protein n=1 Tax=unclassified Herbiconiux TaxID=2618217 RepID=UPI0014930801|nr:hypothetical protein [Herbiconiux sp. SALV-R1]QJU52766.1 hypothetical protein HL652_03325 [Herbiconiux sp. SALV-R1]WPO87670.1 hypothetical protein SCB71_05345 [Herbiconiux sp. KACC 21604]